MKKQIHILIFSLITTLAFGQTEKEPFWSTYIESNRIEIGLKHYDSLNLKKAYRIWTHYQVVELIKITDSTYSGTLTNFITHNKKRNKTEVIYQKIKIPNRIVKKLIKFLNAENIETLKDCSEIENYPKGFDGKTYIFEIGDGKTRRVYSYWEPENKRYQNPEMIEIKNVRNILNAINTEFNLWKYFKDFRERLPKGSYSYGMINMIKT
ncbi:hypothetical protein [Hyunsoonleella pacifica]|uniref:Uncharacterized protein n=1 Tax=Hyunsoonleella pacifica TaxID=1080224 RepID=A0A4Q9FP46_9FLAO|nr:hypothetical protein [Hyunsoonleella pacifica]TBN15774.1 hypothetical protein EYD46_11675 [Hyunsoonleella pacifica]GGD22495.1 hypothetical protein GCM10011368_25730 [Hyunsoonleella pacifica]